MTAARVLLLIYLLLLGCTEATDQGSPSTCTGDSHCPPGMECQIQGCTEAPRTLYPHIRLASVLFRDPVEEGEGQRRATHNDILIGKVEAKADVMRSLNPGIRLYTYLNVKYLRDRDEAFSWAARMGVDPENFYLHYYLDTYPPGYGSTVLVEGFPAGMIPGWNPQPSPGDPPASATERWQARVVGEPVPGRAPWYMANLAHPDYVRFLMDYCVSLVDGSRWGHVYDTRPLSGIMTDLGLYYPQFNEGALNRTEEFREVPLDDNHPYALSFPPFHSTLQEHLREKFQMGMDVIPNIGSVYWLGHDDKLTRDLVGSIDWIYAEVWVAHRAGNLPLQGAYRVITYDLDYEKAVAGVVRSTREGKRIILGARDLSYDPSRGRIFTLAIYYLVSNANTVYAFESVDNHMHQAPLQDWQWNPAVEYDIGTPAPVPDGYVDFEGRAGTSEHYVFANGPDPYDSTLTYRVLARNYTGGLVLVKMLPWGSVTDERSATVHELDGTYRILIPEGLPGAEVNRVELRNNEAVILVR